MIRMSILIIIVVPQTLWQNYLEIPEACLWTVQAVRSGQVSHTILTKSFSVLALIIVAASPSNLVNARHGIIITPFRHDKGLCCL